MPSKLDSISVESEIIRRGFTLMSPYKNALTKLDLLCPNGHRTQTVLGNFRKAGGCNCCAKELQAKSRAAARALKPQKQKTKACRLSYNEVKKVFWDNGYTLLSLEYKNNRSKMLCRCPLGHEYEVRFDNFSAGKRCPSCSPSRRLNESIILSQFKACGYKPLESLKEKTSTSKILAECPKGHSSYVTFSSLKRRGRCCKACKIEQATGKNSPLWRQDLTQKDRIFSAERRHNPKTREWIKAVYKKFDYTCDCCRVRGAKMNAHHLNAWASFPDERFDIDNGVCLCKSCHTSFHLAYGKGKNTKAQYAEWIRLRNSEKWHLDIQGKEARQLSLL